MIKVGKRRLLACAAMCAVLAFITSACSNAALFGLIKSKSKSPAAVRHSLVVFPFDRDSESAASVPDDFGQKVAEVLRSTLSTSKGYAVYLYDERLTPIKRASADNALKEADTKAPFFAQKTKVTALAKILETDYFVVGSVESYTYDKTKKSVDLTLQADLCDAQSGKIIQEFMVGGSAEAGTQNLEEDELRSIAAGKAVEALQDKILASSGADAKPAPKKAPSKAKNKK